MAILSQLRSSLRITLLAASSLAALGFGGSAHAADNSIEVVHLWTAASEAASMQVAKDAVAARGLAWKDSAIAGASGDNLYQALQARFAAGDPPAAVQMHGQVVLEYAATGSLSDLSDLAIKEKWDTLLPKVVLDYMKVDGKYVAVPLNLRRENILFVNKKILDKVGGKVPTTWDEFLALAEKFKAAGVIPLALGGESWQENQVFTDILVGQAGVDYYRKAVMELDPASLKSDQMVKVFDTFRKVLAYSDPNRAGVDWAIETGKLIRGEAGMQFEGDWANGEFFAVNEKPGVDFVCTSPPGNGPTFVALVDYFGMFKQTSADALKKQETLASAVMSIPVQQGIAIHSGSVPARLDVPDDKFNDCSKLFIADRDKDLKDGMLIPSFVENLALPLDAKGVLMDLVTQFANTPSMTSQQAVDKLADSMSSIKLPAKKG